jgi:hypothetical protein
VLCGAVYLAVIRVLPGDIAVLRRQMQERALVEQRAAAEGGARA